MSALVGSRSIARDVLDWHQTRIPGPIDNQVLMLGSGAFRTAYLHEPSGVVYKVDGCARQWSYTNTSERRNARSLAKMTWDNVRIPVTSMFRFREAGREGWAIDGQKRVRNDAFVIAMEFIAGELGADWTDRTGENCYAHPGYEEFREKLGWRRCGDMHGKNFLISSDDDKFVPIDLAS